MSIGDPIAKSSNRYRGKFACLMSLCLDVEIANEAKNSLTNSNSVFMDTIRTSACYF